MPTGSWERCKEAGCNRKVVARGMCRKHYTQWHYYNKQGRTMDNGFYQTGHAHNDYLLQSDPFGVPRWCTYPECSTMALYREPTIEEVSKAQVWCLCRKHFVITLKTTHVEPSDEVRLKNILKSLGEEPTFMTHEDAQ